MRNYGEELMFWIAEWVFPWLLILILAIFIFGAPIGIYFSIKNAPSKIVEKSE